MSGSESEFLARVSSVLSRLEQQKNEIAVFVICCVKGVTEPKGDFASQSVTTEFFSASEVEQILGSLRNFGFYVRPFFSEMDFIRMVDANNFEAGGRPHLLAYNTAHSGTGPGRKALLPSFCALHGIPTTSADAYVVSLARHKFHVARLLTGFGLETPNSWFYTLEDDWFDGQQPPKGLKVILKPTYESASIGIANDSVQIVDGNLRAKVKETAHEYRQPITVQSFVSGWEVEVPVIHLDRPFAPMAIGISKGGNNLLGDDFLTYDDVNVDNYAFWKFDQTPNLTEKLRAIAIRASKVLGLRGFSRIDFRVTQEGKAFITDVSTSPHTTAHSSYAFLFKSLGKSVNDLPPLLVGLASEREKWI